MVSTFDWRIAIGLFVAYGFVDALFVLYTLAVTKHQALRAANVSFLYYFVISAGVIGYVHNYLYVIPVAAGSWAGTYLVVRREAGKY